MHRGANTGTTRGIGNAPTMAAPDRPSEPAVADNLFTAGYRFDFFQAVRLLTRLYGAPASEDTDTPRSRDAA